MVLYMVMPLFFIKTKFIFVKAIHFFIFFPIKTRAKGLRCRKLPGYTFASFLTSPEATWRQSLEVLGSMEPRQLEGHPAWLGNLKQWEDMGHLIGKYGKILRKWEI